MSKSTIVTKLINGGVHVNKNGNEFILSQYLVPARGIDVVYINDGNGSRVDEFTIDETLKVVRNDGTEVTITNAALLFSELSTYFFTSVSEPGSAITNQVVIAALLLQSNWVNGEFVDPGGIIAVLREGDYHLDIDNFVKYEYLSGKVIRLSFNNL
ncbi:MAG: hypothetical protein US15_C0012G0002 [Candidatus Moranbacteria bacterium GW2011_GWF1_36_4]|nr:MAG: hypothetical protein US15_C0012G0002 [Candidatus Moranbacteria bacterium GW2011_GWF1_36_4]